jgi:hypothetical protein
VSAILDNLHRNLPWFNRLWDERLRADPARIAASPTGGERAASRPCAVEFAGFSLRKAIFPIFQALETIPFWNRIYVIVFLLTVTYLEQVLVSRDFFIFEEINRIFRFLLKCNRLDARKGLRPVLGRHFRGAARAFELF